MYSKQKMHGVHFKKASSASRKKTSFSADKLSHSSIVNNSESDLAQQNEEGIRLRKIINSIPPEFWIDKRVKIWQEHLCKFFFGRVTAYYADLGKFLVIYDNGRSDHRLLLDMIVVNEKDDPLTLSDAPERLSSTALSSARMEIEKMEIPLLISTKESTNPVESASIKTSLHMTDDKNVDISTKNDPMTNGISPTNIVNSGTSTGSASTSNKSTGNSIEKNKESSNGQLPLHEKKSNFNKNLPRSSIPNQNNENKHHESSFYNKKLKNIKSDNGNKKRKRNQKEDNNIRVWRPIKNDKKFETMTTTSTTSSTDKVTTKDNINRSEKAFLSAKATTKARLNNNNITSRNSAKSTNNSKRSRSSISGKLNKSSSIDNRNNKNNNNNNNHYRDHSSNSEQWINEDKHQRKSLVQSKKSVHLEPSKVHTMMSETPPMSPKYNESILFPSESLDINKPEDLQNYFLGQNTAQEETRNNIGSSTTPFTTSTTSITSTTVGLSNMALDTDSSGSGLLSSSLEAVSALTSLTKDVPKGGNDALLYCFLKELGLVECHVVLMRHAVDYATLLSLKDEDLKELPELKFGQRKRLAKHLEFLRQSSF